MMRDVLAIILFLFPAVSGHGEHLPSDCCPPPQKELLTQIGSVQLQPPAYRGTGASPDALIDKVRSPNTYYAFLAFLDDSASVEQRFSRPVVRRQLDALQVVLPDSTVERLNLKHGAETGRAEVLTRGAGEYVERWWRWKDPFPATEANERLQEHLKRVAHAFQRYSRPDDDHRLDDRGRVFVRYGSPNRAREVHEGEFWTYGFQTAAEFLFVCERGDGCHLGQPVELIPPRLRHGVGPTQRGMRKALKSLSALESIYKQLSYQRSRYGITYTDLSMYSEQVRQRLSGLSTPMNTRPHSFVNQKIAEIKQEEAAARRRRDKVVPETRSTVGGELETLPVAARWVRSLTEGGDTKVELRWSVLRSSLPPSEERAEIPNRGSDEVGGYLLSSSLIQFSNSYKRKGMKTSHLFAPQDQTSAGNLDPRRESFLLHESPHAALQVDVVWASVEEGAVRPKARLKVGTSRADSLQPLTNDSSVLEMSDLEPVLLRTDTASVQDAPVYPFRKLPPENPLALRFDIYHLATSAQGGSRYTVRYEVLRETNRGGFARLVRGNEQEKTAVESQFEGRGTRTQEYVLLDPSRWVKEEEQTVRITVRVTDQQSGQEVARSVEFNLSPTSK
jgi:GWxTD domain-containing protein